MDASGGPGAQPEDDAHRREREQRASSAPIQATKVVGSAGAARLGSCVKGFMGFVGVCGAPIFLFSLAMDYVWVLGLAILLFPALLVLYHVFADGPRRCIDISWPLRFELSGEELEVGRYCSCRIQRIPAAEVVKICVYRQRVSYGRGPCGVGTGLFPTSFGDPELLSGPEEVKADLVSPASCIGFLCGLRGSCSFAFLGAEIRGEPRPVPLSRRVWHERGGLDELFDLAKAVQRFRQGQLFIGDLGAYATLDEILAARQAAAAEAAGSGAPPQAIAALPSRRLPLDHRRSSRSPAETEARDLEAVEAGPVAEERPECAICLQAMLGGEVVCTLPCGHELHSECAGRWLAIRGSCPLCKRPLQPDPAEPGSEALPEAASGEARIVDSI